MLAADASDVHEHEHDHKKSIISTVTVKDLSELEWDASRVHYVTVDSRDRNKTQYPDPVNYVVQFPEALTNVLQVELVYAQYDKFTDEAYINLVLDECAPNSFTINNAAYNVNAFTQLPVTAGFNEYTRNMYRSIKRFDPPKSTLSRLTVSFRTAKGTRGGVKEHFMRFEIRSLPVRADFIPRHPSGTQEELLRVLQKLSRRLRLFEESSQTLERCSKVLVGAVVAAQTSKNPDSNNSNNSNNKRDERMLQQVQELFSGDEEMIGIGTLDRSKVKSMTYAGLVLAAVLGGSWYARRKGLLNLSALNPMRFMA
jgi:hypothetical protein